MKDRELLDRLKSLGFVLFETGEDADAGLTLLEMAISRDTRFWEAFPFVLASVAEKGLFAPEKPHAFLEKAGDKSVFESLTAMSLALYKVLGSGFAWAGPMYDGLGPEKKKEYDLYLAAFEEGKDINVEDRMMSAGKLKKVFKDYFRKEAEGLRDLLSAKEDFGLEYAMAQVFSPKQKELFLKKLRGEVLNKTEKEYYSRVVKKKVLALANAELHRLSRGLLSE